jgi:hypothetical protein
VYDVTLRQKARESRVEPGRWVALNRREGVWEVESGHSTAGGSSCQKQVV